MVREKHACGVPERSTQYDERKVLNRAHTIRLDTRAYTVGRSRARGRGVAPTESDARRAMRFSHPVSLRSNAVYGRRSAVIG